MTAIRLVSRLAPLARNRSLLVALYLPAIVWVNAYVCRQVFFLEYTGQMHSMHGVWIGMARLAREHWWTPGWWPYWFGGMPFELTYAPLLPGLTALLSRAAGLSPAHAFNVIAGLIYCLAPVLLFVLAARLTGRPGWSFIAAIVYSLSAPTELLLPDGAFRLVHLGDARRFTLNFVWDEAPHHLALALVLGAIICLHYALGHRGPAAWLLAGVCSAGAVLANAFGATALLLFLACFLPTFYPRDWKHKIAPVSALCLIVYLVVCPFVPPSLLGAIRMNANLFPESAWTSTSFAALAAVGCGWLVLIWFTRSWSQFHLRFFLLLAYLTFVIPAIYVWWGLHFIPQPARYKTELEMALVLVVVFSAARVADRLPVWVRVTLVLPLLWLAATQVVSQRRFSKREIRPVNISESIEYRAAKWVEANLPGRRVMAAGSMGQWMNAFTAVPQFGGGSYPTAPNAVQQMAMWGIYPGGEGAERDDRTTVLWLKAFGVAALIVPGRGSPEFWKPFREPEKLSAVLPCLWKERDTLVLEIPGAGQSLAHVIPVRSIVRRAPADWTDVGDIRTFVAALEDPGRPAVEFHWLDVNRAAIQAEVPAGDSLAVSINYHPGWKARANGTPVPVVADGLGQIVLRPACNGACTVELAYDGGIEEKVTRWVSLATIVGVVGLTLRALLRRKSKLRNEAPPGRIP